MSEKKYVGNVEMYLALKIKGCDNHMTVAWLGRSVDPEIVYKDMKLAFDKLFNSEKDPFKITLYRYTHFGPNCDIPVYTCFIEDKEKEEVLFDLWKKYNVEQEHTKGLERPNWHVKSQGLEKTVDVGTSLEMDAIYIKEVGKNGGFVHYMQID